VRNFSHRERLLMALNHQEADRIPFDFGGTTSTGIFSDAYRSLKEYLGIAVAVPIRRVYPHTDQVRVDIEIVECFGADVLPVRVEGTDLLHYADKPIPLASRGYEDDYGIVFDWPEDSPYTVVKVPPLADDPDPAKVSAHVWPDPRDARRIEGLHDQVTTLRRTADRALAIGLPGRFLSFGQRLCGYENWMIYSATESLFVETLMDKALEIQVGICEQVLGEVGDEIDVVMFADDLGTQRNLQVSPRFYRSVIKPRQKQLFDAVKKCTDAKVFLHSDGAIASILPDLIEVGIDIINPVQPTCEGMNLDDLKRDFGKDITFWGAIDTQSVLPFGTPAEVRDEVRRRIDQLAAGGGYVLAAVHNLQPEVPPENIVTMFDTALEFGRYV